MTRGFYTKPLKLTGVLLFYISNRTAHIHYLKNLLVCVNVEETIKKIIHILNKSIRNQVFKNKQTNQLQSAIN